jgi:hypothetical protein
MTDRTSIAVQIGCCEACTMIAIAEGTRGILARCALFLALTGCAFGGGVAAAQSQVPPVPVGMARVWILRQYRPMASQNMPMISVNGVPFARSEHASLFYHDFAPGTYHFTVEIWLGLQPGHHLQLSAGMQPFLEVIAEREFVSGDQTTQDTFYIRPLPLYWASKYFPTITYLGAR